MYDKPPFPFFFFFFFLCEMSKFQNNGIREDLGASVINTPFIIHLQSLTLPPACSFYIVTLLEFDLLSFY